MSLEWDSKIYFSYEGAICQIWPGLVYIFQKMNQHYWRRVKTQEVFVLCCIVIYWRQHANQLAPVSPVVSSHIVP